MLTTHLVSFVAVSLITLARPAPLFETSATHLTHFNLSNAYLNATQAVFKVLRIVAHNKQTMQLLHELRLREDEYNLDFWKPPRILGGNIDVMVPPEYSDAIPDLLNLQNISYTTIIPDVEKLIKTHESRVHAPGMDDNRQRDDASDKATFNFRGYNSYSDMVRYMKYLSKLFPDICKFLTIGKTHEGRYIHGLKIGFPLNERKKRMVWIDGGIHAREWAAGHTVMFFLHQLLSQYKRDKEIKVLVDNLTWYIFPMINPDGYEHSRSSSIPNIRMWRKNRAPGLCTGQGFSKKCCKGVDLNRNFDWHWMETDTSKNPCSIIYGGKSAMSEPEARAVGNFVLKRRSKIDMFITIHTYGQLWLHAFGHAKGTYPADLDEVAAVGKRAAFALEKVYGTKFSVGSGADALYPSSGGSDDWAKGKAKIKYTYLLELRPDDQNMAGFILREDQLLPTAMETWEGVKVVAKRVILRARKLAKLGRSKGRFAERAGLNAAPAIQNRRRNLIQAQKDSRPVERKRWREVVVPRPAPPPSIRISNPSRPTTVATPPSQARFIIRTTTPAPLTLSPPIAKPISVNDFNPSGIPPRRAISNTRRPQSSTIKPLPAEVNEDTKFTDTKSNTWNEDADFMKQIESDIDLIHSQQPRTSEDDLIQANGFNSQILNSADDETFKEHRLITQQGTNTPNLDLDPNIQEDHVEADNITTEKRRSQPSRSSKSRWTQSQCQDTEAHCKTWINNNPNLCYVSKNSMKEQCAASCAFCKTD